MLLTKKDNYANFVIFYLGLSNLIFLLGWFKPVFSIPICIAFLYFLVINFKLDLKYSLPDFKVLVLSFLFTIVSGIGGFGFQNSDYEKHNIIFKDLIANSLPVTYPDGSYLVYYVGYYLPTAMFGKLISLDFAAYFCFLWAWLGVFIFFRWVFAEFSWYGFLLFVFVGPIFVTYIPDLLFDVKHLVLNFNNASAFNFFNKYFIEIRNQRIFLPNGDLGNGLIYSNNIAQFFWAPHSTLAAWLAVIGIVDSYKNMDPFKLGLINCLVLIFSPFIFISILPFSIYLYFKTNFKNLFSKWNFFLCLPILFLVGLYFMSHKADSTGGFIFENIGSVSSFLKLFFFYSVSFLLLAIFGYYFNVKFKVLNPYFELLYGVSVLSLLLIPLYHMGIFNDWIVRVSTIPFLIFTLILSLILKQVVSTTIPYGLKYFFMFLLFISSYESINSLSRNTLKSVDYKNPTSIKNGNKDFVNITEFYIDLYGNKIDLSSQYLGEKDSFYIKYLKR